MMRLPLLSLEIERMHQVKNEILAESEKHFNHLE